MMNPPPKCTRYVHPRLTRKPHLDARTASPTESRRRPMPDRDMYSAPRGPLMTRGITYLDHAHPIRFHAVCCLFVFFFSWHSMLGVVARVVMVSGRVEPRRGDKPYVTEVLPSVTCRREIVVC